MTHQDLQDLVEYNYWARDRVLSAVTLLPSDQFTRDLGSSFTSVRDTLVHIYSAEWVWYSRWTGVSPAEPIRADRFPDLASVRKAWVELEGQIRAFVERLADDQAKRAIDYRLMNGNPGRSTFQQMVQHVVNHGAYHRGQVTTMLRQLGAAPPQSTDLITFFRERGSAGILSGVPS